MNESPPSVMTISGSASLKQSTRPRIFSPSLPESIVKASPSSCLIWREPSSSSKVRIFLVFLVLTSSRISRRVGSFNQLFPSSLADSTELHHPSHQLRLGLRERGLSGRGRLGERECRHRRGGNGSICLLSVFCSQALWLHHRFLLPLRGFEIFRYRLLSQTCRQSGIVRCMICKLGPRALDSFLLRAVLASIGR